MALDYEFAELEEHDRAMLDYAAKLTRSPQVVGAADIERLREVGFEDAAILDICQVTSYYNYVNRMADGLGVELEDAWRHEDLIVSREDLGRRSGRG